MRTLVEATPDDIWIIQLLAKHTWPATFADILSTEQIDYMLEMMYSKEALLQQMQDGHHYLLVHVDGEYIAYLSYQLDGGGEAITKIHKIYVLPLAQKKGLGNYLIAETEKIALANQQKSLMLNVNRYNKALSFYQREGFVVEKEENIAIGNGFLMEDYVLVKPI